MESKKVIINSSLISFLEESVPQKEYLLLLHGWRCSAETMQGLADVFKQDFSIIAIDFPGFGYSDLPKEGLDIQGYTEMIHSFLLKKDLKKVHILGHSFGGRIGINFAAQFPEKVQSLILINSGGIKNNSCKIKIINFLAKFALKLGLKKYKKYFYKIFLKEKDVLHAQKNLSLEKTFRKIVSEDLLNQAKKITCPCLLLWGATDTETPLEHGKIWHEHIYKSELYVHPGDHFFFLQNPEWVYKHVQTFLK